ncbi:anti-sigma factor antagonist [Selenomonas ruminantium]|uniref:anti-sigma factor antagonist n=1 Tax=Selenomonas ruminantium TaxID=971 RepID=UPI00047C1A54|nr:anti-sigma factor antagonist [Selenomonas ruminantium]
MNFTIRQERQGDTLTMFLTGEFNKLAMDAFDKEFLLAAEGVKELLLDFSGVTYLSSAGLRSLLQAAKIMESQGGSFTVLYPQEVVMDVFEMTHFDRFIHIVREGEEQAPINSAYYPLRPIQRWLTDTHFRRAKSTMMNTGALVRLETAVDLERLAAAVNGLLESYDIFRCRLVFRPDTGEFCQRFDGKLEKVYVESLSEEGLEERKQELKQPYDLIDRPLYRVNIIKTPESKYIYMDFYHAIMDGAAIVLLFWRELEKRYVHGNEAVAAKRQPASYADYVREEAALPEDELAKGRAYWETMLAGFAKDKHLPPMDGGNVDEGPEHEMETPLEGIEKGFFKGKDFGENAFFMAAAMLAIAKAAGRREAIISWVHNGRVTSAERRLMGLMLDQFPLRWDFEGDMTVEQFLPKLEARITEGIQYRKGMDKIYEEGLEAGCACFILQKGTLGRRGSVKLGDTQAVIEEMPANEISAAENTLDIELNAHDDGTYSLVLDYDPHCYSRKAMEAFTEQVEKMAVALQDGGRKLAELL